MSKITKERIQEIIKEEIKRVIVESPRDSNPFMRFENAHAVLEEVGVLLSQWREMMSQSQTDDDAVEEVLQALSSITGRLESDDSWIQGYAGQKPENF